MAFPTTSILDNFNRSNGALGSNWTSLYNACVVDNNQISGGTVADANLSMWSAATFGADSESYWTIATKENGVGCGLFVRVTTLVLGTFDGYYAETSFVDGANNDSHYIARVDNGTVTQLGSSFTQEVANGDSLGLEAVGSTIKLYYKAGAGSWSDISSGGRSDSTYGSAGYVGVNMVNVVIQGDDFGGGTVAGGEITETVNQTSETDTAQAIAKSKAKVVGQNTETDSVQTISVQRVYALAQTSETDAAQALSVAKVRQLGQVSETDEAQALGTQIVGNVGQAAETDEAFGFSAVKQQAVGLVSETDESQSVTGQKAYGVGQASETDGALAASVQKVRAVALVTETDIALGISRQVGGFPSTGVLDDFNRADEAPMTGWTDVQGGLAVVSNQCKGTVSGSGVPAANNSIYTAQSFSPDQEAYVTIVQKPSNTQEINLHVRIDNVEAPNGYSLVYYRTVDGQDKHYIVRYDDGVWDIITDEYYVPISNGDMLGIRIAGDVVTGYRKPVGGEWTVLVPPYDDSANHATHYHGGYVGLNHNSDSIITDDFGGGALVITSVIGLVDETDGALAFSVVKQKTVGQASETDEAQGISSAKYQTVGQADETDDAFAFSSAKYQTVGQAEETDSALTLGTTITEQVGLVVETDFAQAFTAQKVYPVGIAVEADSVFALAMQKVRAVGMASETDAALEVGFTGELVVIGIEKDLRMPMEYSTRQRLAYVLDKHLELEQDIHNQEKMD